MVQQTTTWVRPLAAAVRDDRSIGATLKDSRRTSPATDGEQTLRLIGTRIEAKQGATLPDRCVCCGDTIELRSFRTLGGSVRYFVCREHCVSASARLVVGIVMTLLGAWSIASPILSGGRPGTSTAIAFGAVFLLGVGLTWFAIPVRAGMSRGGWRSLSGVCDDVRREVEA